MTTRRLITAALLAAAAIAASGCARTAAPSGAVVSGRTRVDVVSVGAPRLQYPTIDVSVGIARTRRSDVDTPGPAAILRGQMAAGSAKASAAAVSAQSRRPAPAGVLASVPVRTGDRVKKGQVVAVLDDTLLRLGLADARAAARKAAAQAGTLSSLAADLRDARADARAQGRAQLASGQAKIDSARAQLASGVSAAEKLQPAVPAMRSQLKALQAQLAALLAKPAKTPADEARIAALREAIGKIRQGLGVVAQLPALRAALKQLDTAQAQLDAGRARMDSGLARMAEAIARLDDGSALARVFADIPAAAVVAAETSLAQATLRAPCDGVVVEAMQPGEVPMVAAPVVTIRPSGPTLVDTYLTAEQSSGVKVGTSATVSLDSLPRPLAGRVAAISAEEGFAPSNYPTKIVHLSSVVRVTVSVPDELPAGVPADVVIGRS